MPICLRCHRRRRRSRKAWYCTLCQQRALNGAKVRWWRRHRGHLQHSRTLRKD